MATNPNDPNAIKAIDRALELMWGIVKPTKKDRNDILRCNVKHLLEEGDAKMCQQSGKFVCEAGYAFTNIVDQCKDYIIYRCDGGNHIAIVFVEHKERTGETGNTRRIVIKNGEYVYDDGAERHEDRLELD